MPLHSLQTSGNKIDVKEWLHKLIVKTQWLVAFKIFFMKKFSYLKIKILRYVVKNYNKILLKYNCKYQIINIGGNTEMNYNKITVLSLRLQTVVVYLL